MKNVIKRAVFSDKQPWTRGFLDGCLLKPADRKKETNPAQSVAAQQISLCAAVNVLRVSSPVNNRRTGGYTTNRGLHTFYHHKIV
jgi:hypothetical protein